MKKYLVLSAFVMTGCASITPTRENIEGYRIYDVPATYSSSLTMSLAGKIKSAMQKRANDVQVNNSLPPATLPENPSRFELINPFKGATGLMALASANGASFKIPRCEGSVIEATSHKKFDGAENTTFFVCLIPYQKGYRMNVYYRFDKVSGGFSPQALGRAIAQAAVGDSSQFIPLVIASLEEATTIETRQPVLIESYPE